MSKIAELIKEKCSNEVEYKEVGLLVNVLGGYKSANKKEILNEGLYPVIDQGQKFISGYSNDIKKVIKKNEYIIFGDHTRIIKYVDFDFIPGDSGVKILQSNTTKLLNKYLFHCLKNLNITNRGYNRHWIVLSPLKIPVPPIEVQREIANILDKFVKLEAELEAELEARKNQYEFWRGKILNKASDNIVKIKEIATCIVGATPSTNKSEYWEDGEIQWMSSGEVNKGQIFLTDKKITKLGYENSSTKLLPVNTVVIALAGQGKTRGTVAITRTQLCTNQSLCGIVPKKDTELLPNYLFYFLQSKYKDLRRISSGDGTRGGLNLKMIGDYEIILPTLKEQKKIVNILDNFDKLINDISEGLPAEIELRRKQYEYYRNKLLSFEELFCEEKY